MNDWHNKIKTAKNLLLKEGKINNRTHTLASFVDNFNLSIIDLITLTREDLVQLGNYFLEQGYISEYKRRKREREAKIARIRVASMVAVSGHLNTESTHNSFTDEHCGLGKGYYEKLKNKPKIEIRASNFEALAKQDIAQKFVSFDIEFSPKKIQEFLNEKIDKFIKDELDLTTDDNQKYLSY